MKLEMMRDITGVINIVVVVLVCSAKRRRQVVRQQARSQLSSWYMVWNFISADTRKLKIHTCKCDNSYIKIILNKYFRF